MTTGHIFIAASLDGFIARQDGNLDWLMSNAVDGEDCGYSEFFGTVDGLVMGRGTYQKVLTFGDWPYTKPVVVMSQTLTDKDIPMGLSGCVQLSTLPPKALMKELGEQGWNRAYIDGGKVIQSFLSDGLIEDMIITRAPILIGSGKPLFGKLTSDIKLEPLETHSFSTGMVQSKHRVIK